MSRRHFCAHAAGWIGALGLAWSGPGCGLPGEPLGPLPAAQPESLPTPLSAAHQRALAAVADRILPRTGPMPAASELGAVEYVLEALADPYRNRIDRLRTTLDRLQRLGGEQRGEAEFGDLGVPDQVELLGEFEAEDPEAFAALRRLVVEGAFSHPNHGGNRGKAGWQGIGLASAHHHE